MLVFYSIFIICTIFSFILERSLIFIQSIANKAINIPKCVLPVLSINKKSHLSLIQWLIYHYERYLA